MIPLTNGLAHLQLASVLYDLPRQVVDPHITIKDTIVTKVLKLATVAALTLAALSAQAASEPAVIYDTAGKFDKSFNEAVFRNGVEVYNKDKGVKVKEFEPQNEAQREQGLRRLASRGNGPIVAVGFNMGSAVEKVATEFPNTQFTIIDMVVEAPNVQSIVFREEQGSYLAGMLAALRSGQIDAIFMTANNQAVLPPPGPAQLLAILQKPKGTSRDAIIDNAVRVSQIIGSPGFPAPEDRLRAEAIEGYDRSYYPAGVGRQFAAILGSGSLRRYNREIAAPTVVIHGKADKLMRPSGGRAIARAIKNARLVLFDGMGHELPEPLWDDIVGELKTTFAEVP